VTTAHRFDVPQWRAFLQSWSDEILAAVRDARVRPADSHIAGALERGTILREPASEARIDAVEKGLGVELPDSLKRFYRASDGMTLIAFDAASNDLWPVDRIRRFVEVEPEFVAAWEGEKMTAPDTVYFDYGPDQNSAAIRSDYLRSMWQLSPFVDSAVLLLNPVVVGDRGEWEAWFLGVALPGARRFRSFEEMMVYVRHRTTRAARGASNP
jgi:hypothetical protein